MGTLDLRAASSEKPSTRRELTAEPSYPNYRPARPLGRLRVGPSVPRHARKQERLHTCQYITSMLKFQAMTYPPLDQTGSHHRRSPDYLHPEPRRHVKSEFEQSIPRHMP
ncbi:hypothetical protein KJ359_000878 [Pestalotiopsis sp. 9143b]|nr:hypothetical protein KJ359_000878 [Pestalotiopsis sp. 9143b]